MMTNQQVRLQVNCQKGKTVEAELLLNGERREQDGVCMELSERAAGECRLGELRLNIENDPIGENANLALETPVRMYITVPERPEKITAMYLFNPWWTRPAFVDSFREIPKLTQIAFFQYPDRFACFVPMVGNQFKTCMTAGTEAELCLEMFACVGGQAQINEPVYLYAEGATVTEAVHKAFCWLAKEKGIRMREERRLPDMFHYLGWCSWDAFNTEITEEKVRQKAAELVKKQIPIKWMLFDDGWLSVRDKMLYALDPEREKFPNGFRTMIDDIREQGDVRWFGVWHALGGYWNGIHPDSALAGAEGLLKTANGTIVPSPKTGSRFYDDWYKLLGREGINFVKVDGQSSAPFYFENTLPVSEAARGMNEALERGTHRMDNAIINCMGMAMENILARPTSAVSRSSNDFVPMEEGSFTEHLVENTYNSLYQNELYYCDWDMFWTNHEDAARHSLLRAISGGPVYVSDRIGDTIPEVLKPLAYIDGNLLMMARSAKPTADCIFSDPMKDGVLKLHNIALWGGSKAGGIAVYNLTSEEQNAAFAPADIPELEESEQYWVYDYFQKKVCSLGRNEAYQETIPAGGFGWYVVLPKTRHGSCLGLLEKYAGFMAVENVQEADNAQVIVLHESGTVGWASEMPPQKVIVGVTDVTAQVQKNGELYTLPLPELAAKAIITIRW